MYERHKGCYGQRRIAAALDWNRKKAAQLMRQLGLKALIRAKKAYRHPAMGAISEHLLKRRFKARKPNEKWLTDVTELKGRTANCTSLRYWTCSTAKSSPMP
ncbi:TPA: hypothetical protein ACQWFK_001787 [Neisseria subflava]